MVLLFIVSIQSLRVSWICIVTIVGQVFAEMMKIVTDKARIVIDLVLKMLSY